MKDQVEEKINDKNEKEFLRPLLVNRANGEIGDYQNTIAFVYGDEYGIDSLTDSARMVCAIEDAERDERIRSDKDNLTTIRRKLTEGEGNLISECLNVYSKIAYPYLNDIRTTRIDRLETKGQNITESVLNVLIKKGKLIASNLSSDAIKDSLKEDKTKVEDIYSLFKQHLVKANRMVYPVELKTFLSMSQL